MEEITGLLLVDHGSRRAAANELLACVAGLVAEMAGPRVRVVTAHMELCPPSIETALAELVAAGITKIRVVPYFLGPGRHATEDIPRLVAEAKGHHPGIDVTVAPPLGVHHGLAGAVLDRAALPVACPAVGDGCTGDRASCRASFCRRRDD